jgi:hypothetical protein
MILGRFYSSPSFTRFSVTRPRELSENSGRIQSLSRLGSPLGSIIDQLVAPPRSAEASCSVFTHRSPNEFRDP